MNTDEPMPARRPLHIDAADMRSFKESWNPTNCHTSLHQTLMYEAGGNLCWIDGEVEKQALPTEDPPLKWMPEFEESGFYSFQGRVKFPVVMECHVEKAFDKAEYPYDRFADRRPCVSVRLVLLGMEGVGRCQC